MKKTLVLIATLSLLAVVGAGVAEAQSGNGQINVRARNIGIFEFTITDTDFDFGDVDSNGTLSSTGVVGARNGGDDGAVYNADAATTWTCSSAPPRTVRIHNASTTSVINWGTADRLSVRIPDGTLPGGSTSCGLIDFTTTGDGGVGSCASGALVHSVGVGNGSNTVTGNLDFELDVLDADGAGINTWTVVLTATGS
jgi:hypothetical protein